MLDCCCFSLFSLKQDALVIGLKGDCEPGLATQGEQDAGTQQLRKLVRNGCLLFPGGWQTNGWQTNGVPQMGFRFVFRTQPDLEQPGHTTSFSSS